MKQLIPLLLIVSVCVTGCGSLISALLLDETAANPAPVVDAAQIERGIAVYRANYCGSCHTLSAANTRGTFGPPHDDAATLAITHLNDSGYGGAATTAEDYIRESILQPSAFYTPGYETTSHHMPAFSHLPQADIDALVYLLVNQRGADD